MRAVMILAGVALIERFHWILYVFGALLIISGLRMALARHAPDPEKNPFIALARRLLPVTENLAGEQIVVRCGSTVNWLSRRFGADHDREF
jgi:tellurite resistance protein TerC